MPPEPLPSRELTSAPVSEDTCCRSTGAPAYAPIATTSAAMARAAARRTRTRRRWPGVPGCARERSWPGPGTVCSQDQTASRPPSARRDTPEQAAITQATSTWVRCPQPGADPLQAIVGGLGRVRRSMQRAAQQVLKVVRVLGHASGPSTPRSADMARKTWLLTAPWLIPIAEAISASGRSA